MSRFDRLTSHGVDPVEAMRRVAPFFDRPAAREHPTTSRSALAGVDTTLLTAAEAATRASGDELGVHDRAAAVLDDPATDSVNEAQAALQVAGPHRPRAEELYAHAAQLHAAATSASGATTAAVLEASVRTPPEIARDGYPEPLNGQVLAGGRVKPKTPDRTAPAAMRSTSLATAARAVSGRAR
jgi:hypothetical protein